MLLLLQNGRTALMKALESGHMSCVKEVFYKGAEVNMLGVMRIVSYYLLYYEEVTVLVMCVQIV